MSWPAGRFECFDADRDLLIWVCRAPPAGVVLSLITLFRGAGLLSLDDDTWALPDRTCRLAWRASALLSASLSAAGAVATDVGLLNTLRLRVIMGGGAGRPAAMAVGATAPSEAASPSLSRALVSALSFMGAGISSSELSCSVEKGCGSALTPLASPLAAVGGTGVDSLRLSRGRDVGRLSACRAEVRRPNDEKRLPCPTGVGDVVAMSALRSIGVRLAKLAAWSPPSLASTGSRRESDTG